ncbi:MAG: class I SAM-dependent methyltransferase [Methanothrix sp.]|nr:class I SAM-dependent methyltransferase [Methanothrix sp.]
MNSHLSAWNSDYCRRGRLWAGRVHGLPDLPAPSAVLELGCGNGKTLGCMPAGWQVTALDVSLEALRLCRRSVQKAELILADARALPFQDESFDAVFAFHVTGHLPGPGRRALAREAARVLTSGGRLFFREFGLEDMREGHGEEVEPGTFRRGSGIITHYFAKAEVEELFLGMKPLFVGTQRWKLRVKGDDLVRCEVDAVFLKV